MGTNETDRPGAKVLLRTPASLVFPSSPGGGISRRSNIHGARLPSSSFRDRFLAAGASGPRLGSIRCVKGRRSASMCPEQVC